MAENISARELLNQIQRALNYSTSAAGEGWTRSEQRARERSRQIQRAQMLANLMTSLAQPAIRNEGATAVQQLSNAGALARQRLANEGALATTGLSGLFGLQERSMMTQGALERERLAGQNRMNVAKLLAEPRANLLSAQAKATELQNILGLYSTFNPPPAPPDPNKVLLPDLQKRQALYEQQMSKWRQDFLNTMTPYLKERGINLNFKAESKPGAISATKQTTTLSFNPDEIDKAWQEMKKKLNTSSNW